MFIRGNGAGTEARRTDDSFYRGIVVRNNDPLRLNRVKIFIPEISPQPYDDWLEKYEEFNLKIPGKNTPDTWDTKLFEEIARNIPWAEPCFPLFGESSNSRYISDEEIVTLSDCNYPEGYESNNTEPPTLQGGSFSPAFIYENEGTPIGDAFSEPLVNFTVKCNSYAFNYRPSKHVNQTKGMIGIPEVGAKLWVFHYQGNLNFPVYFGVSQDYRSLTLLNNTDNKYKLSPNYP